MLKQVYIIINDKIAYYRSYAKGIDASLLINVYLSIKHEAFSQTGENIGIHDFFESRILYLVDKELNLLFFFVLGFSDDIEKAKPFIKSLKKKFLSNYGQNITEIDFKQKDEELKLIVNGIQRNFRVKISIVGLSGVGKTTTTRLIKSEEIPTEHIPTITGKVATIELEGVNLYLWDFAGQNQFDYLWENFMTGSDAILLMTDSTQINMEKNKNFIDISSKAVPYARIAIIANKQDLPGAMKITEIENQMGQKTYSMVAIEPGSRDKIIRIIADLLDLNPEVSPLLKPLFERDMLIKKSQNALEQGDLKQAVMYYDELNSICNELGDESMAIEFKNKADKLRIFTS